MPDIKILPVVEACIFSVNLCALRGYVFTTENYLGIFGTLPFVRKIAKNGKADASEHEPAAHEPASDSG
jgi:hypothetical protein